MNPYPVYKDSGIEWIGEIPEHWEMRNLKRIISEPLKYGANEPAESIDKDLPRYIRITDFGENGELRDETFKSLSEEKAKDYLLREGDLLLARSGATVGKSFLFRGYRGKACFAGYLIKATFNLDRT
ncbi:MAG: restriction endonuclease subunit S, partial [Bacteroidota bacterium]